MKTNLPGSGERRLIEAVEGTPLIAAKRGPKPKIDPVLADARDLRPRNAVTPAPHKRPPPPRSSREGDMGSEAAHPAPEGAPRSIADLPERFRKPAKPPVRIETGDR